MLAISAWNEWKIPAANSAETVLNVPLELEGAKLPLCKVAV